MNRTKIYYKKKLKFRNPVMIVGLPGIGSVGSLVAEYLKNELDAKRFATLYSPHFIHQTIMLKSGSYYDTAVRRRERRCGAWELFGSYYYGS